MFDELISALIGKGLLPHGYCLAWSPWLLWTYVLSNTAIAIAYFTIPVCLIILTRTRSDLRYNRVVVLFAIFILACGSTHVLDAVSIWLPVYWLSAWVLAFTAIVSLWTTIELWRLIPQILAIPSPRQLAESNTKLLEEMAFRQRKEDELTASEEELRALSANLEAKVESRTLELAEANARLLKEIADRKYIQRELQIVNEKLETALTNQEAKAKEIEQLNKLGGLMQCCISVQEVVQLLCHFSEGYLGVPAGAVYLIDERTGAAIADGTWGNLVEEETLFSPDHCWALRRSQIHPTDALQESMLCKHMREDQHHICLPLIGNSETIGLLHLRQARGQHELAFLDAVAKRAALALATVKTREALFSEATHDALTGLYNRRYLDGALADIGRKAARSEQSVGLLMLDIDHFKEVNDQHGHDGGDTVLRELAARLRTGLRTGDIACRFGGEEFMVVMIGSSLATTQQRAEQFRLAVESLRVTHGSNTLQVTVSIGIANFPVHGERIEDVLLAADAAMYIAKQGGRNRTVIAPVVEVEDDLAPPGI